MRNLATLDAHADHRGRAADLYLEALALAPGVTPLIVESMTALLTAGRHTQALNVLDGLDSATRSNGRVRLLEAIAGLQADDPARAARFFGDHVRVVDLQEGDNVLEEVWLRFQAALRLESLAELPPEYRFRMRPSATPTTRG
jgi:hypothetical protein